MSGLVFCGGMELRLHLKLFKDNTIFVMCVEPAGFSEMHGGVSAPSDLQAMQEKEALISR